MRQRIRTNKGLCLQNIVLQLEKCIIVKINIANIELSEKLHSLNIVRQFYQRSCRVASKRYNTLKKISQMILARYCAKYETYKC